MSSIESDVPVGGWTMKDANKALRQRMTYRPSDPAFSGCRTRAETRRIINKYISALGLDVAIGLTAPPDAGGDAVPLRFVHVAGTKGKGSTCAMVESILRHHGMSTGFFSSPHLVSIRERIRLNGNPVPEPLFLKYFGECTAKLEAIAESREEVGFFRFMTLLALLTFARERVDAVVLEVGIGGRLDATNVIVSPTVCAISLLDYDHMNVLGSTLPEIAREKAGILKHAPAFTVPQQTPQAAQALVDCAKRAGTTITTVTEAILPEDLSLGLLGNFQRTNAALAVAAASTFLRAHPELVSRKDTRVPTSTTNITPTVRLGLEAVQWPGRAQIVEVAAGAGFPHTTFALDGAHTTKSVAVASEWYHSYCDELASASAATAGDDECKDEDVRSSPGARIKRVLFFNCGHGKQTTELLKVLAPQQFDAAVFAPFDMAKPTSKPLPTTAELLSQAGLPTSCSDASAGAGASSKTVWQESLRRVWVALRDEDDTSLGTVCTSVQEALTRVLAPQLDITGTASADDAPRSVERVCVFVTGSLYLVGNTLAALGWDVDSCSIPPPTKTTST